MKKLLISLILATGLLSTTAAIAQDGAVDKKPLLEVFTASTCPPCVGGNLAIDGVLVNHPGDYTLIKYQMNWPGDGDPYYMEASAVRRNFYAVSGVPHLRTNGIRPHPELENWYPQSFIESDFTDLMGAKTNISITAEGSVAVGAPAMAEASTTGAMVVTCHVEVKAHADYAAGLKTYIMVVEEGTFENVGTNGETEFHNVVQGYVVSSEGDVLEALTTDQVITYDLSLDLAGSNTETGNDLLLVVFVQDPATMDVKQSEMVEITHPFVDYSASFDVYDEDFNPVDGGRIAIALAGETRIMDSKATKAKLLPGTYQFEVVVPGLLPYDGEFTVTDTDVQQDLFIEIPPFLFYEDFENTGFPEGWTFSNPLGDYLVWNNGRIVYQKTHEEDEVYLILPIIGIDQGSVVSFKAGDSRGRSDVGIGVVTDLEDPGSSYTEIAKYEIFNIEGMRTFGGRLDDPGVVGDGYLCLKLYSTNGNYFYLDNVIIIENQPGYKVQFLVTDHNGEILPEVEVIMIDEGIPTNTFGYATWRNCDHDEYYFAINYKGVEVETGTLTVDGGDILKEISINTSGIEELELDPFRIYPNPAQDVIIVTGFSEGTIQIMDLEGRMIKERSISGQTSIQVADLAEGVYLIKISTEEKTITKKLFITK